MRPGSLGTEASADLPSASAGAAPGPQDPTSQESPGDGRTAALVEASEPGEGGAAPRVILSMVVVDGPDLRPIWDQLGPVAELLAVSRPHATWTVRPLGDGGGGPQVHWDPSERGVGQGVLPGGSARDRSVAHMADAAPDPATDKSTAPVK